ncbi:JmjC domain-containing protein [Chloropicon primus]|uniref:JmjC domain-containing protein n=1 Tax=Chloropicon primus TaxID=1764295 RepID=A0A5B8MQJ9_9CHLO|nr:JmjC domain-containing protein [Chloropicon primus]UPR01901.1 JmjC domain-containing protein [Chloropicon primus]|eukprot:QDZ22677.1 JmjC domain-containing protein [Chloropicon primus]
MAKEWSAVFPERLRSLLSQEGHGLRPTDESIHHQQKLARKLEICKTVYDTWTEGTAEPAKMAKPMVDGRLETLREFVTVDEGEALRPREEESTSEVDFRDAEDLSYEEFWLRYMYKNEPVVIRRAGKDWRALREWVSSDGGGLLIDVLEERFGDALVWVTYCSSTAEKSVGERERWTFREYLVNYWQDENKRRDVSLYLKDWHFPTEFADYGAYVTPEYFKDDWLNEYYDYLQATAGPAGAEERTAQQAIEQSDYRFLYMGPKGTKTGLHADVLRSYSWSINISGRKKWYLLPPRFTHLLYDTFGHNLAPSFFDVDEEMFPNIKLARKHLVEVHQGVDEVIFVPSGWHHTVENLEDTLSINHNWFNVCNINYSLELLQRERHEAEQAICDCRAMCKDEKEFEELVQRNVAANASMNYENFASLLIMVAETRVRVLKGKGAADNDNESLKQAYEAKMAVAVLHQLLERITSEKFRDKLLVVVENVKAHLPHVNFGM